MQPVMNSNCAREQRQAGVSAASIKRQLRDNGQQPRTQTAASDGVSTASSEQQFYDDR